MNNDLSDYIISELITVASGVDIVANGCLRYQISDVFPEKEGYQKLFIYPIIKDAMNQYVIICSRSNVRLFYWNTSSEQRTCTPQAIGVYVKNR